MGSKLSSTNPYLRHPAVRQSTVFTSVSSSSAIEGIHAPFRDPVPGKSKAPAPATATPPVSPRRIKR